MLIFINKTHKTGEIALSSVKTHKSTVKMLIITEK